MIALCLKSISNSLGGDSKSAPLARKSNAMDALVPQRKLCWKWKRKESEDYRRIFASFARGTTLATTKAAAPPAPSQEAK